MLLARTVRSSSLAAVVDSRMLPRSNVLGSLAAATASLFACKFVVRDAQDSLRWVRHRTFSPRLGAAAAFIRLRH